MVIERLNVGDIKSIEKTVELRNDNHASLVIQASHTSYRFGESCLAEFSNFNFAYTVEYECLDDDIVIALYSRMIFIL